MRQILSVEISARGAIVARAIRLSGDVPQLVVVDGTEDDVRRISDDAFGAENVLPLTARAAFDAILATFPSGLAGAFGAYSAVPCYS